MDTIPVYAISAHSCLVTPHYAKQTNSKNSMIVPKDTYIVSFGSPGDYSLTDNETLQTICENLSNLRKFMNVHSTSDIKSLKKTRKRTYSLFAHVHRAAPSTTYPNISYTLNNVDKERPTRKAYNEYGVYRLDTLEPENALILKNKDSLIPQDIDREDFYLEDLIQEVYKKTGIHRGIFINLGCLTPFRGPATAAYMETLERIYEEANTMYNTLVPTLTAEEILETLGEDALPKDVRLDAALTKTVPEIFEKMVNINLYR